MDIGLRSLLLESNDRKILIETGIGSKLNDKKKKIFNLNNEKYSLMKSLNNVNVKPDDITDVILTHLHMDHSGGATYQNEKGDIIPTFKNAKYYIQKTQYEYALNPSLRDRASFMKDNYKPLVDYNKLKLLDGECELFEGIYLKISNGHTPALQIPIIKGKDQSLVYISDLAPSSYNIPLLWNPVYDLQPLTIIEEKQALYEEIIKDNCLIHFGHEKSHRSFCEIQRDTDKNDFKIKRSYTYDELIKLI